MIANHFRQSDEDPYRQAHRPVARTEPEDRAEEDMLWIAAGILLLLICAMWGGFGGPR